MIRINQNSGQDHLSLQGSAKSASEANDVADQRERLDDRLNERADQALMLYGKLLAVSRHLGVVAYATVGIDNLDRGAKCWIDYSLIESLEGNPPPTL